MPLKRLIYMKQQNKKISNHSKTGQTIKKAKSNKKTKFIIGLAIWLLIAYSFGKYSGNYAATNHKQCSVILDSILKFIDEEEIEILNHTSELLIEKHVEKGIAIYLVSIGGLYFFELGYHSSYQLIPVEGLKPLHK
jgi:hypothetical protein